MTVSSTSHTTIARSAAVIRLLLAGTILFAWTSASADPVEIKIGYLRGPQPKTSISLIDIPPENNGIAGAQLAINDNNTTGKFLNQRFSLEDVQLNDKDDVAAATSALAARGVSLVIADLPAAALLKAADAAGSRGLLFFNVGAIDDRLREEDCRANVIHTAPTRSMLADALAQYLVWKQWRRWFLVVRLPRRGQAFCRCDTPRRQAVRGPHRSGEDFRGHRRRAPDRQRRRADPAPTAGVHARRAGLRCPDRRGRERRFCRLSAVPDLGCPAGRRLRRPHPDQLGCFSRSMGSGTDAGAVHEAVLATNDRTRHAGVVGGAHDRRKRVANALERCQGACSIFSRVPISLWPRSKASG